MATDRPARPARRYSNRATAILVVALSVSGPLSAAVGPEQARSLATLEMLAGEGAPRLALHHLDQNQPARADYPASWLVWERRRLELLSRMAAWRTLDERVAGYPRAELDTAFLAWADEQRARALEAEGDGIGLRELVFQRLWRDDTAPDVDTARHWQRWLVRAYQLEGQLDAAVTLVRQLQPGVSAEPELHYRQATILLGLGRPAEALSHLRRLPDDHAVDRVPVIALRLLAEWRAEERAAEDVVAEALRFQPPRPDQLAALQAVVAAASPVTRERVAAMESLLLEPEPPPLPGLPAINADTLWAAYEQLGRRSGGRRDLVFGDAPAWLAEAETLRGEDPLLKRAVLAVMVRQFSADEERETAHRRLAIAVLDGPGERLLQRLYTEAGAYADPEAIPLPVRYTLIDGFLAAGELDDAARLLRRLETPPEQAEAITWRLQRARVLILTGDAARGAAALESLLDEVTSLERRDLDRAIQLVFDLQGAKAHDEAISILIRLQRRSRSASVARELLFWVADSHRAMERHAEAAEYYLRAARHIPDDLDDPWVETAYYRAARALADAGFGDDARRLYQRLLGVTDEPRRRALLRNELGRLDGGQGEAP